MGRELNMDTQRQNFWKEAIQKEAYVRLGWHEKYGNEFGPDSRKQQKNVRSKKFLDMVPKPPTRDMSLPVINYPKRKPIASAPARLPSEDPNALLIEMRSVTPNVRRLLYHGFTKEGRGRYQYLQRRTLKKPEDKYEFPLTTSWEYGWRLSDVVKEFEAPQHGRSRIVRDTFFRRNGILYEPITA